MKVHRKKVLVVPYVRLSRDDVSLVIFQDAETDEWTLISGGCKTVEDFRTCAERELSEETYGTFLSIPPGGSSFRFFTTYRPEKFRKKDNGRLVKSLYSVHLFELSLREYDDILVKYIAKLSEIEKNDSISKVSKETKDMDLVPLRSLYDGTHEKKLWQFISRECVPKVVNHFHTLNTC